MLPTATAGRYSEVVKSGVTHTRGGWDIDGVHCQHAQKSFYTVGIRSVVGLRSWASVSYSHVFLVGFLLWFLSASACLTIKSLAHGGTERRGIERRAPRGLRVARRSCTCVRTAPETH